ncbi:aspartate/glutamate racemase family protein [Sedimentibacter sp.]|uniref:aspartate/glutamate racemase family protein n=1 Tax=Sedimentibacter sp. TaxID=1960295 RepID=UPI0028A8349F|nr:aspartate/glutamate racemase family protein [Sedimentibacter sp.]
MSKILWINPIGTNIYDEKINRVLAEIKQPMNLVDVISLKKGPEHLEYMYYEALVTPDILHIIKQAEKDGYDAAIIGCFYDLALFEAKELVDKMVIIAPAQASSYIAAMLGHKFSVIVTRDKCIPQMTDRMISYGMKEKLASFKSLGLGVNELHTNEQNTFEIMKRKAGEAIEQDGAEVIVLGCTIQFGFYEKLQRYLGVPVIDAVAASLKYAEYLAELKNRFNWIHSKKCCFESPPIAEIKKWNIEEQYNVKGIWE